MQTLILSKVKPGMILAEPVHNFQGILLLDSGAELSEKSILILKSWGVSKVSVEGESEKDKNADPESASRLRAAIEKKLRQKFSDVRKDPVMKEIMRVAGKVLEKRALTEEDEEKNH